MYVGLKCSVFEKSSLFRHMCELHHIMKYLPPKPIIFLYSDGGADHRLTYVTVQLSLICLFLKLYLDYLCVCRTAPYHSYMNPVERIMSILNMGSQCVGLARAEMPEMYEKEVSKCNTLSELRNIVSRVNGFEEAVQDSLSPVKICLANIFTRLQLHDKNINIFTSCSSTEISDFWTSLIAIDSTLKEIHCTKKISMNFLMPKSSLNIAARSAITRLIY